MAKTHKATCYCGAVEIELRGEPLEMGYCHCEACRRYSAAPVSAFTLWKIDNVKVTKGAEFLGKFKQSEMSDRRYCTKCGSHIMVDHPTLGLIDVRLGALRNFSFKQQCTSITKKPFSQCGTGYQSSKTFRLPLVDRARRYRSSCRNIGGFILC